MKEMIDLLMMEENEVLRYCAEQLRGLGNLMTSDKNYVYLHTGHPLMFMAHADTVNIKNVQPVIKRQIITNGCKGEPLGADDRAGVYAILEMVRRLRYSKSPLPNVLITNGEETGGSGARAFIADAVMQTEGLNLIIALDRKGSNDWVHYVAVPTPCADYIEEFGYVRSNGSYNDVANLNRAYHIPGVNLSIGYYSQHTGLERLHLDELSMTITRIVRMAKSPLMEQHLIPESALTYGRYGGYGTGYNYAAGRLYDDYDDYGYGGGLYSRAVIVDSENPTSLEEKKPVGFLPAPPESPTRKLRREKEEAAALKKAKKELKAKMKAAGKVAAKTPGKKSKPTGVQKWIAGRTEPILIPEENPVHLALATDVQYERAFTSVEVFIENCSDTFGRCEICAYDWHDCVCGNIASLACQMLDFLELQVLACDFMCKKDVVYVELMDLITAEYERQADAETEQIGEPHVAAIH